MTKSELVARILAKRPSLSRRDIEGVVNATLGVMQEALQRGDRIELRGFGMFTIAKRSPRIGRNPRTGVAVEVPEKRQPLFRPAKQMRRKLGDA